LRNPRSFPRDTIDEMLRQCDSGALLALSQTSRIWQRFISHESVIRY
jgi:hypothetical protein